MCLGLSRWKGDLLGVPIKFDPYQMECIGQYCKYHNGEYDINH